MVNIEKPEEGTNLSGLLKKVIPVEGGQKMQNPSSSSSSLSSGLANLNTVSERTMSRNKRDEMGRGTVNQEQAGIDVVNGSFPLRKTTLEDFLAHASIVSVQNHHVHQHGEVDPTAMVSHWAEWIPPQEQTMKMDKTFCVSDSVCENPSGTLQAPGKLHYSGEMMQKTIERKQKRMIKNRESAARSRVKRQAYNNQLELEVKDLRERNNWLKQQKEMEMKLLSESKREIKYQLRRTSSAPF